MEDYDERREANDSGSDVAPFHLLAVSARAHRAVVEEPLLTSGSKIGVCEGRRCEGRREGWRAICRLNSK